MTKPELSLLFAAAGVLFCCLAGGTFVAMGLELNRKGRPTRFLSFSFDPRERLRVARGVFTAYHQLKQDEGRPAVLPVILWLAVGLVIVFLAASLAVLAVR